MQECKKSCNVHLGHERCSIKAELLCHLPYALLSAAFGLLLLSLLHMSGWGAKMGLLNKHSAHRLFHGFHFLHIVFATTGCLITFSRFSKNMVRGFVIALLSALFFCTLSDIVLPYLGGRLLGWSMHFHLCFISELHNVLPFLIIGLINGLIMSRHSALTKGFYSVGVHFIHILTSSLASLFYLVAEGFYNWYDHLGLVFIVLVGAVIIPCTIADVIVPMFFARQEKVDEEYQTRKC